MTEKMERDRVIEGKKERQKTMDKLSVESGEAYTYARDEGQGAGCLSNAKEAREKNQQKINQ